jgi:hypothetical protein
MFQMSPEDMLRNVMHYQEEQRKQASLERMARPAVPAEKPTEASGARSAKSSHSHSPRATVIQLLRSLTGTRTVAPRHPAR